MFSLIIIQSTVRPRGKSHPFVAQSEREMMLQWSEKMAVRLTIMSGVGRGSNHVYLGKQVLFRSQHEKSFASSTCLFVPQKDCQIDKDNPTLQLAKIVSDLAGPAHVVTLAHPSREQGLPHLTLDQIIIATNATPSAFLSQACTGRVSNHDTEAGHGRASCLGAVWNQEYVKN